jgi:hypothetical protein
VTLLVCAGGELVVVVVRLGVLEVLDVVVVVVVGCEAVVVGVVPPRIAATRGLYQQFASFTFPASLGWTPSPVSVAVLKPV